jgi:uncharacterized integral membrane protein
LRYLKLILSVFLLATAVIFGAINAQTVWLNFGVGGVSMPLGVAILLAAAAGAAVAGALLWSVRLRQLKRELRAARDSSN